MPHSYDTGLPLPQRTLVRRTIVQFLGALRRPAMYLQTIRALPSRIGASEEDKTLLDKTLGGAMPAMLVALGRGEPQGAGMPASNVRKSIEVIVYVVSGHARGLVEGRLEGDAGSSVDVTKDPGIDTMLEHAEQVLVGRDLGISGVAELRLESEDEVYSGDDYTIWEMVFSVRADRSINHDRGIEERLLEIEAHQIAAATDIDNPVSDTRTPVEAS